MKIIALLLLMSVTLPPNWCAPVLDEDPDVQNATNLPDGVHNHTIPYRDGRFSNNVFGIGDINVAGHVQGDDVSIGSKLDIDVSSHSFKKDKAAECECPACPGRPTCPADPDCSHPAMIMPKGPQGPPDAVLEYDLLSNSQAGINYPSDPDSHLGAFIPATMYNQQNGAKQIYVPSAAHQDPATNQIDITAEKFKAGSFTKITSARLDTKGVWTTAQSLNTKNRGYLEVRALMPAKTNGNTFKGAWPAIRMIGADEQEWPKNGEINIVELKNGDPTVHMTLHSTNYRGSNGQHPPNNPFHLSADMTKIPVIFGLEWNVDNGLPDQQNGMISLTWWITSFDVSSQQWKSEHTMKSLLEHKGDANDFSVFKNAFNGDGFYLLVDLAVGGDFTGVFLKKDLLMNGTQHIIIESAKVYRLKDHVPLLLESPGMARTMTNIGYLFRGYDFMKGNPLNTDSVLPMDPGFRQQIFKATYESGKKTPDQRYKIPDGTSILDCTGSCSLSFKTESISGAKSYQKSLGMKVSQSAGAEFEGFGASFTASAGFKHVSESTTSHSSLFTVSSATCCSYLAQFQTFTPPPLSENFLVAVGELTDTYDEKYLGIIHAFGTHFLSEAQLGALYGQQSKISKEEWTSMVSNGFDISIGASASAYGATASREFQVDAEKENKEEFRKAATQQKIFTIGIAPPSDNKIASWVQSIKSAPAPMALKLRPIVELFDSKYITVSSQVKANMKRALDDYCGRLAHLGEVSSCSELGPDPPFPKPVPPMPTQIPDRLHMGYSLSAPHFLRSSDGTYDFVPQGDGNLVIYRNFYGGRTPTKSSGAKGYGSVLKFQGDGNVVLYLPGNNAVWATHTADEKDAQTLLMQNDGNLVLYTTSGQAIWSSNQDL